MAKTKRSFSRSSSTQTNTASKTQKKTTAKKATKKRSTKKAATKKKTTAKKKTTTKKAATKKKTTTKKKVAKKKVAKKSASTKKKAAIKKKAATKKKTTKKKATTAKKTATKKKVAKKKATTKKKVATKKKTTKKKTATKKKAATKKKTTKKKTKKKAARGGKARRMTPKLREKAAKVQDMLEELYPETPIPLDHKDAYTLLVAVLLSAQCTDIRVNQVTPHLFAEADTPQDMIQLEVSHIQDIIRPCGLSGNKSRAIWELSQILLTEHGGEVPQTFEALERLPGVGHKTASVVMAQAFGVPAFPVDTHIHRLAARWGLSDGRNVVQTERDLKAVFPEERWNKLHLQIIFFGREYCPARNHDPDTCPICSWAS